MKMTLLAVGSKMPRWVDEAFTEYARRLPREASLHLVEIKPEKRGKDNQLLKQGQQYVLAVPLQ